MDISKQYDDFAEDFSKIHDIGENSNRENRKVFYGRIDFIRPGMSVLDLGCGDGLDLAYYKTLGVEVSGFDISEKLVKIAKERLPEINIQIGSFEKMPFQNGYFDVVLSKYAIQTSGDLAPVFEEIYRVLKPGGILMYLVTHPFRQYFEKKNSMADYFKQEIVDAHILNNAITVKEPSHTIQEYFSDIFLKKFDIQGYQECWDPAAEQIDGKKYPGYFILTAKKRI